MCFVISLLHLVSKCFSGLWLADSLLYSRTREAAPPAREGGGGGAAGFRADVGALRPVGPACDDPRRCHRLGPEKFDGEVPASPLWHHVCYLNVLGAEIRWSILLR